MELFSTLGVGGLVGLVIGIGLNIWINPATIGGIFLLIAICVAVGVVTSSILAAFGLWSGSNEDD